MLNPSEVVKAIRRGSGERSIGSFKYLEVLFEIGSRRL